MLVPSAQAAFPGANGKIAFESGTAIHTVNPDGTGEASIGNPGAQDVAWSADGTRIAYDSGTGHILVANADGTGTTNIGGTGDAFNPAWSPDGRIAYESSRVQCEGDFCFDIPDGIFVMNADGTGDHRLTTRGTEPAWSPDGTKIAFTDYDTPDPDSVTDIYVMNADGTGIKKLAQTGLSESEASWSPDGSKVAFSRTGASNFQEIWAINADGSGPVRLADDSARSTDDRYPAWSPDGTRITFQSDRRSSSGPGCPCVSEVIVVMDASDGNQTTVAFGERPDWQPIPGPQRSDFKNAARFCKAERDFLGDAAFTKKYGGGANAYGKCVRGN